MQATSPIRGHKDLTNALKKFFIEKNDSLFSSSLNDAHFRWKLNGKKIKPNYKLNTKRLPRQSISKELIENGSFYIFSCNKFLKTKKRLFGKIGYFIQKKYFSFEIDDKEDLNIIQSLMKDIKIFNKH